MTKRTVLRYSVGTDGNFLAPASAKVLGIDEHHDRTSVWCEVDQGALEPQVLRRVVVLRTGEDTTAGLVHLTSKAESPYVFHVYIGEV